MTLLKNSFLLLFACSILFLTSCKDDDCTAPIIDENIVGTWQESFSGDEVEFKADGTLIDENDALVGVGDASTKTYAIVGNGIDISATEVGGGSSATFTFSIEGNECDEIKLGVLGFTSTLTRQ